MKAVSFEVHPADLLSEAETAQMEADLCDGQARVFRAEVKAAHGEPVAAVLSSATWALIAEALEDLAEARRADAQRFRMDARMATAPVARRIGDAA